MTVTTDPRFIAPMNLRLFLLGLGRNGHVVFGQPLVDGGRALFIRLFHGFLGREAPPLEGGADRANRQPSPILRMNDFLHGLTGPQGKGEFN